MCFQANKSLGVIIPQKIKEPLSDQVQFIMTPAGFLIQQNNARLVTRSGEVTPGSFQFMEFADRRHNSHRDAESCQFLLQQPKSLHRSDHSIFHIVQPYGERKPRLVAKASSQNFIVQAQVQQMISTTRAQDGYHD